jgi:hypothetical protein
MVRAKPDKCSRVAVRARRLLVGLYAGLPRSALLLGCSWDATASLVLLCNRRTCYNWYRRQRVHPPPDARSAHALPARRTAQRPVARAHAPTQPDREPGWS